MMDTSTHELPLVDPHVAQRAQADVTARRLEAVEGAVVEHARWARRHLPTARPHDVALRSRARRIGEGIDLKRGF